MIRGTVGRGLATVVRIHRKGWYFFVEKFKGVKNVKNIWVLKKYKKASAARA